VKWAVAEGILKGRASNAAVPGGESTRAELATLFKRYAELFTLPEEDAEN
jgi:hypothetical protein